MIGTMAFDGLAVIFDTWTEWIGALFPNSLFIKGRYTLPVFTARVRP